MIFTRKMSDLLLLEGLRLVAAVKLDEVGRNEALGEYRLKSGNLIL